MRTHAEAYEFMLATIYDGRTYRRTGKLGTLSRRDRLLNTGTIGEVTAEYETADGWRVWINLDGEIVEEA